MKFGDSKIVAEAAYIKNENDITSSQTALNQKLDADIYSLGIHGQHRFTAGNFQFVPSVGVRVSRLNTDSMQVGSVNIKKQEQTLVQVPIALRVNGFEQNAAGWFVSPSVRIAYVPTFGDKEISVLGLNQSVIDTSPVQETSAFVPKGQFDAQRQFHFGWRQGRCVLCRRQDGVAVRLLNASLHPLELPARRRGGW